MAKAVLVPQASPIPIVPSFTEFLGYLSGQEFSLVGIIRQLQSNEDLRDLPFSERTLRNAGSTGVKVSTAQEIAQYLGKSLPYDLTPEDERRRSKRWTDLKLKNNGLGWDLGVILPLEKLRAPESQPKRAMNFLRRRIEAEFRFLSRLTEISNEEELTDLYSESVSSQKLLPSDIVQDGIRSCVEYVLNGGLGFPAAQSAEFHRFCLYLRIDFAYGLLANYENDLIEEMVKEVGIENTPPDLEETGLFGDLVPDHEAGDFTEPLALLFDQWRITFSDTPTNPLTHMDLARMLPFPHGVAPEDRRDIPRLEDAIAIIDDIRRSRINAWRNGTKRPGDEHLSALVENLVPERHDPSWALLRGRWANTLGRFIAAERKRVEQQKLPVSDHEVTKAFCQYSQYRKFYADTTMISGRD